MNNVAINGIFFGTLFFSLQSAARAENITFHNGLGCPVNSLKFELQNAGNNSVGNPTRNHVVKFSEFKASMSDPINRRRNCVVNIKLGSNKKVQYLVNEVKLDGILSNGEQKLSLRTSASFEGSTKKEFASTVVNPPTIFSRSLPLVISSGCGRAPAILSMNIVASLVGETQGELSSKATLSKVTVNIEEIPCD